MRYAIYHALRHKQKLYEYLTHAHLKVFSITELTPEYFRARKVHYIALDFDGVLASHGEIRPTKEVEDWLAKITQVIPASHFALLSNNLFSKRIQYLQTCFPRMVMMSGVAKKPHPEGLNKLVEHFQCSKNELVLVDDRLLTGMLAVCLAGVQGIYIEKAYQNVKKRPLIEGFFSILRKAERAWIRWLVN